MLQILGYLGQSLQYTARKQCLCPGTVSLTGLYACYFSSKDSDRQVRFNAFLIAFSTVHSNIFSGVATCSLSVSVNPFFPMGIIKCSSHLLLGIEMYEQQHKQFNL